MWFSLVASVAGTIGRRHIRRPSLETALHYIWQEIASNTKSLHFHTRDQSRRPLPRHRESGLHLSARSDRTVRCVKNHVTPEHGRTRTDRVDQLHLMRESER